MRKLGGLGRRRQRERRGGAGRPVGQRAAAATSVSLPASGDSEEAAGASGRLHVQRSTIISSISSANRHQCSRSFGLHGTPRRCGGTRREKDQKVLPGNYVPGTTLLWSVQAHRSAGAFRRLRAWNHLRGVERCCRDGRPSQGRSAVRCFAALVRRRPCPPLRPPCFSSAAREGQRAFAFDGGGGRARACGMFRPGAAAAASERQHRDGRQSLSPIGRDRRDHGAVLVRRRRDRAAAA
jgi:hypothetical protein